jgi:hypothetical protein
MVFVLNTVTCGAHFDLTSERCIFPAATIWTKTTFSNITVGKCDFFKIHTVEKKESIYCTNKSQNKHYLVRRYFLLFNKNEQ